MSMKVKCTARRCGWIGLDEELVESANPFIIGEILRACPRCGAMNSTIVVLCDEPGCNEEATCGWPVSPSLYRRTCGDHMRSAK